MKCGALSSFCLWALVESSGPRLQHHEHCIVGAGPGGIQTAYRMKKDGSDFVLIEKGNDVSQFFRYYPRYRGLISINKRNTGESNKDYNMRHDWNSLVSDEFSPSFTDYTKAYWPHASFIPQYLEDFVAEHKLDEHLHVDSEVTKVAKTKTSDGEKFILTTKGEHDFSCEVVIISTGRSTPKLLEWRGAEHFQTYNKMNTDLDLYENKTVLVVGGGNSALEIADQLSSTAAFVHVFARSKLRLAFETHYVGDVRALNLEILDRYLLKSQDALLLKSMAKGASNVLGPEDMIWSKREDGKIEFRHEDDNHEINTLPIHRRTYDYVISAIGHRPDVSFFDESARPELSACGGWFKLTTAYESANVKNLFFAGNLGHYRDYRESSSGFIHGFRYVANALPKVIQLRRFGWSSAPWPSTKVSADAETLTRHIFDRVGTASSLYQMFKFFGDVAILNADGKSVSYHKDVPQELLRSGVARFGGDQCHTFMTITLEYNPYFHGKGVLDHQKSTDLVMPRKNFGEEDALYSEYFGGIHENTTIQRPALNGLNLDSTFGVEETEDRHWLWRAASAKTQVVENFIHPVLRVYKREAKSQIPELMGIHHVMEDLHTLWELETVFSGPARPFIADTFLPSIEKCSQLL